MIFRALLLLFILVVVPFTLSMVILGIVRDFIQDFRASAPPADRAAQAD